MELTRNADFFCGHSHCFADSLAAEEPTSGLRDGSRTANLTDLQLRGPDGTNTAPASDEDTVSNASEVAQSQQLGGAPPTAAAADEDSAAAVAALPLQEQQPAAGQPPRRASRTMARAQDASQPASSSADAEDTAAQADGRPGQATNAAAPWAGSGGSVAAAIDEANADIVGAAGRNAQPPAAKEALNDEAAALELPAAPAAEEAPQSMATAAADADSRVAADEGDANAALTLTVQLPNSHLHTPDSCGLMFADAGGGGRDDDAAIVGASTTAQQPDNAAG